MAFIDKDWKQLKNQIENCKLCPRLRKHCTEIAQKKRKAYLTETYWGRPVTGFGDPAARIWIIGLAPGAHGANRTGRMFTGDKSGEWVYRALFESGFSNQENSVHHTDKLQLKDIYISAAGRCAPPDNKPTPEELGNCFIYLEKEYELLKRCELILCLGRIAYDTTRKLLEKKGVEPPPANGFGHGKYFDLKKRKVLCSYHPSQQNTQTGRLTWEMWRGIFARAKELVGASDFA